MRRLAVLAGRLLGTAVTIWLSAVLLVGLIHAAPGDALASIPDGEALRPALAARWHLDEPWPMRVVRAATRLVSGDLGISLVLRPGTPVGDLVGRPAALTLGRTLAAWLVLGVTAMALALRTSPTTLHRIGVATMLPLFAATHLVVTAINAAVWHGMEQGWWDRPPWFAMPAEDTWHREALAVFLLAGTSGLLGDLSRELRAAADALRQGDAAELVQSRGESTTSLLARHLVVPAVDRLQARLPALLAGSVIIEHVLLLPGAGTLFWDAAELRDVDVAGALALLAAGLVAVSRLATDTVRLAWDPREST